MSICVVKSGRILPIYKFNLVNSIKVRQTTMILSNPYEYSYIWNIFAYIFGIYVLIYLEYIYAYIFAYVYKA